MYQELTYNEQNISLIRTAVENRLATHEDFFYSVKVNDLMILPRTRDASLFDCFREHVNGETKTVTFLYYSGKARGADSTVKLLANGYDPKEKEKKPEQQTPALNGPDKEEMRKNIYCEVQNDFLEKENARLKTELEKKDKELDKAQKFAREVDVLIAQFHAQKEKIKDKGTLEYIGNFVSKLSAAFPELLGKNSKLEALMGLFPAAEEKKEPPPPLSQEISGTPETVSIKSSQQTQDMEKILQMARTLRPFFSDVEFHQVFSMMNLMRDHKEFFVPMTAWVKERIKQKLDFIKKEKESKQPGLVSNSDRQAEEKKQQPDLENKPEEKQDTQNQEETKQDTQSCDEEPTINIQ